MNYNSKQMLSSHSAKRVTQRLTLQTSYKSVVFTAAHAMLSIVLTMATLSLLFAVLEALPLEANSHK